MPEAPILVIRRLSKGFPGVRALAGVDFFLHRGEIHALMGENGAGKSTLIKVLTGVYPRDGGEILFEGRPFAAGSPHKAQEQGISTVYAVSDRITVLRNGELVAEFETSRLPKVELISKLLGKALHDLESVATAKGEAASERAGEPVLRVQGLGKAGVLERFDLEIHAGEVLGLAGLLGSGRTELANLIFGIEKPDQGEVEVQGEKVRLNSPLRALQSGIGLCPEDRKSEGIIEDLSLRENIVLALQVKQGWFRNIPRARQEAIAERYIKLLDIRTPTAAQAIKNLSGGNQQKAIVARWLATQPTLLILDEPTRGIDVGAKAEIQKLILSLSDRGMAVLFISSELDEVLRCADRIAVLRDKAMVGKLSADQMDEQIILRTIAQTDQVGAEPR